MALRPITFLSDYGYSDEFAGVCRAVIASIAPEARVIDITHGIGRHAVRQGAVVLANSLPFAPVGVHLAVVDPGVGSDRRPVAVEAGDQGRILVGPDNGLLSLAVERLGGAQGAVDLSSSSFQLEQRSMTFHGRDLFAPVAAHLSSGATLDQAGEPIDPAGLIRLELPEPRLYPNRAVAHVVHVDGFGNVALNLAPGQLSTGFLQSGAKVALEAGRSSVHAHFGQAFSDVAAGEVVVYEDSSGSLAIAVNRGSAANVLSLSADDEVVLVRHG